MIGQLDPEKLRANQRLMNKRGKIIGIAMMAGSALITLVFALFAWQSIESYNWPETDGVVTYASYTGALDSKTTRSGGDTGCCRRPPVSPADLALTRRLS